MIFATSSGKFWSFQTEFIYKLLLPTFFYPNLNKINWDWLVVDNLNQHGAKFYSIKPSVIQHIGIEGLSTPFKSIYEAASDF